MTEHFVLTLVFDCAYWVVLLIYFLPGVYGRVGKGACVMNGIDKVDMRRIRWFVVSDEIMDCKDGDEVVNDC